MDVMVEKINNFSSEASGVEMGLFGNYLITAQFIFEVIGSNLVLVR